MELIAHTTNTCAQAKHRKVRTVIARDHYPAVDSSSVLERREYGLDWSARRSGG